MPQVYRLYAGLSRADSPEPIDGEDVIDWTARQIDSFTVSRTQGVYRGRREETLVITVAWPHRDFIVTFARRLCAYLGQEAVGLESGGVYERITAGDDPQPREREPVPARYPNYNVRVYRDGERLRGWCRGQGIPVRVYESFDGGGFNFYIFEFESLEHARRFVRRFDITGENDVWLEAAKGDIHYIGGAGDA